MNHAVIAILVFVLTTATSVIFVTKTSDVFSRLGMMDQPGPRRVHKTPIPRGLGVAIFLAFLVGIAITYILPVERQTRETERILLFVIGSAIVVGVMLVDDAVSLGPRTKLVWQIIAAAVIVLPRFRGEGRGIVIEQFNSPFGGTVTLPEIVAVIVTFVWIISFMNVMNWVDGLDGLAGSVTLVSCVILFIHTYFGPDNLPQFTISMLPLALGAAIVGFLPSNWHPAKVIMGDAGAMFLGFALAIIAIIGGAKIATALLALGLPIMDAAWVIIYRIMHGRSPLYADKGHLHHRLLEAGFGQRTIVLFVAGTSAVFGAASLLIQNRELKLAIFALVAVVLLVTIAGLAQRSRGMEKRAKDATSITR